MGKITIGGREFDFQLTVGSWKCLQEKFAIGPLTIEEKLSQDLAGTLSAVVYYGLTEETRREFTQDQLDQMMDLSIAGQVAALIRSSIDGFKEQEKNV
jgi:hypothetical protein